MWDECVRAVSKNITTLLFTVLFLVLVLTYISRDGNLSVPFFQTDHYDISHKLSHNFYRVVCIAWNESARYRGVRNQQRDQNRRPRENAKASSMENTINGSPCNTVILIEVMNTFAISLVFSPFQ